MHTPLCINHTRGSHCRGALLPASREGRGGSWSFCDSSGSVAGRSHEGQRPGLRMSTSDLQHCPQTQLSPNQAFSLLGDLQARAFSRITPCPTGLPVCAPHTHPESMNKGKEPESLERRCFVFSIHEPLVSFKKNVLSRSFSIDC